LDLETAILDVRLLGLKTLFKISLAIGAVRRTAPIKNSFVQFGELHVQIFARCSVQNCTPAQVIGAVQFVTDLLSHSHYATKLLPLSS